MPTRKLSALIIDNAGLTALSRATQCIAALQRLYVVCAPPDMVQASRVVNKHDGMLVIAADNGTIAAKLRQQAPRLLKNMQKQGGEVTGIRVQVQVERTSPAPRIRAKKASLPIDSIDNFESLSKRVKDPGLRSALARFVARRRSVR
ncbi:MAG: DciA family protein [Betaproteobacteria bacterium]